MVSRKNTPSGPKVHAAYASSWIAYLDPKGVARCEGAFPSGPSGRSHAEGVATQLREMRLADVSPHHVEGTHAWAVGVKGKEACETYVAWLKKHDIPVKNLFGAEMPGNERNSLGKDGAKQDTTKKDALLPRGRRGTRHDHDGQHSLFDPNQGRSR